MAASSQARTRAPRLGSLLCKRQESSPDSSSWRPRHPSLRRYRCQERLALETRSDFPGWPRLARQSSRYSCTEKHTPAVASGAARRPSPPRCQERQHIILIQLYYYYQLRYVLDWYTATVQYIICMRCRVYLSGWVDVRPPCVCPNSRPRLSEGPLSRPLVHTHGVE